MPLKIRKFNAQVKDPETGEMIPAGLLSSDALEVIESTKTDALDAIEQKGDETLDSIPADYTALNQEVTDLKEQIDNLAYHFDESPNLVNPDTITRGKVVSSSGEINSSATTDLSDYIKVTPLTYYSWSNLSYVARYNSEKVFEGRTSGTSQNKIYLSSTTHYVRVMGATGTGSNWRFNVGETVVNQPYHEYPYLRDIDISPQVDEIMNPMLFETVASTSGIFENGTIALSSGNLQDNLERLRTKTYLDKRILNVTANTGYEFAMYAYDDDQYRGSWTGSGYKKDGVTQFWTTIDLTTAGDNRFKIVIRNKADTFAQLSPEINGDCLLFYQYKFEIEKDDTILDRIMFSRSIDQVFSLDSSPAWEGTAQTMTSAQVYALFDGIASNYSTYVTKIILGLDDWGNELAIYKASPVLPTASYKTKTPKIFVNCSIHGYEHVPAVTMYLVLKSLCENWSADAMLNVIRHEVELYILPVANPSGFNAYTRKNGNGVDLNRNFPAGFSVGADPTAQDYGGASALSEKETQYIYNWLSNNKDVDIVIDFHNFGAFDGGIDWITIKNQYQAHIARNMIQRMTQKFKSEYSWLPQGADAYYGYTSGVLSYNGLVKDQASAFGVPFTYTFELPRSFWGTIADGAQSEEAASMAPIHRKVCCECVVNFILMNLYELARNYEST